MATPNVPQQQTAPKMTPQQQDAIATRAILSAAVDRGQLVAAEQIFPAQNPVLIVQPINVGLIKRFIIVVEGTIANTGTVSISFTDWGLANIFGQNGIQYTDLNNFLRVNTSGQHLTTLAQAKRRRAYGSTVQDSTDGPFPGNRSKMTNVPPASWNVFEAPDQIAAGASGNFRGVFELPLAYTDDDLRGAVWANVLNAVQQITLTVNPQAVVAAPNDANWAMYSGLAGAAGGITSCKVTIYQEYLDQLPKTQAQNGMVTTILPALSLSTVYELKSTLFTSISPNQEFYIPYANQRSFISTITTFSPDGVSRNFDPTDVTYWALLAANASYIWKYDPLTIALKSRDHLNSDLPGGTYYFPTRRKNIATLQFGNLQLTLNASTATANGYVNVMWEAFALQNTLQSGASLSGQGN